MRKPRPLLHLLLALLLLVSQHAAFAHWVAHGISGQHRVVGADTAHDTGEAASSVLQSGQVSVEQACQECLFMAQAGSAPIKLAVSFADGLAGSDACCGARTVTLPGQNPSPFQSRAPPQA